MNCQGYRGFKLGAICALIATLLQVGCSSDPTTASSDAVPFSGPVMRVTASLSGPDSVWTSGTFTYTASYNAPYAWFEWATRQCPTSTVASCTTAWFNTGCNMINSTTCTNNHFVSRDCTLNGQRSFQVRVIAHAFGQVPQTLYKVTNRCRQGNPNA
jgi:hypothetical protein